jgi:hypothetical protein
VVSEPKRTQILLCEGGPVIIMPLRRCVELPIVNRVVEMEMRELCARLEAMEAVQRREPDVGDISEVESEETEFEEAAGGDVVE